MSGVKYIADGVLILQFMVCLCSYVANLKTVFQCNLFILLVSLHPLY